MVSHPDIDEFKEEPVSVCRTAIGDSVRSITYFTADDYEQLYLRDDLEPDAEIDRRVANERLGFTSQDTYGDTELGEYLFTIRIFEWGYLTRTIVGDHRPTPHGRVQEGRNVCAGGSREVHRVRRDGRLTPGDALREGAWRVDGAVEQRGGGGGDPLLSHRWRNRPETVR